MECLKNKNLEHCNCTYSSCPYTGMCCDCMARHLTKRQLPACFFSAEAEQSFNRSFEHFAKETVQQAQKLL